MFTFNEAKFAHWLHVLSAWSFHFKIPSDLISISNCCLNPLAHLELKNGYFLILHAWTRTHKHAQTHTPSCFIKESLLVLSKSSCHVMSSLMGRSPCVTEVMSLAHSQQRSKACQQHERIWKWMIFQPSLEMTANTLIAASWETVSQTV